MPSQAPLTPEQRAMRARLAAHSRWSRQDRRAGTEPARRAFLDRFEREVDPEGLLTSDERARRAESAKKAYFTALALRSSKNRSQRTSSQSR